MKRNLKRWKRYLPWLVVLACIDGLSAFMLWISDVQAFRALILVIILSTLLIYVLVLGVVSYKDQKKEKAFLNYLGNPDPYHEAELMRVSNDAEKEMFLMIGHTLRDKQEALSQLKTRVSDYEEYIETWAHEIKTPISLLTFLLDNRREELPETIVYKLDYIRNSMQESVNQMLYYARLKGTRKDYLFESVSLRDCIEEVICDYLPLLEEKEFQINLEIPDYEVYTDRRGILFLISQIISNSVKYCNTESFPQLRIWAEQTEVYYRLIIKDNGIGVRKCDLPYIFEKGFTGDTGNQRKKATGMGLYLAKEIANELKITLDAISEWGKGFEMRILFPIISEKNRKYKTCK